MALAGGPAGVVADGPPTGLDGRVEWEIRDRLLGMREDEGRGMMVSGHERGLVSEVADDVAGMDAGQIAEIGPAEVVLGDPLHPYTKGLLKTLPRLSGRRKGGPRKLPVIAGAVPDPKRRPQGCVFAPRCRLADDNCRAARPPLLDAGGGRLVACIKADIPLDAHDAAATFDEPPA